VETFPAEWWQEAMPEAHVTEDLPGTKERAARQSQAEQSIRDALAAIPQVDDAVSARTLKVLAGLQKMPSKVFSRVLEKVTEGGLDGWHRNGRGFSRWGFTSEVT
jgi:hypothetical protein